MAVINLVEWKPQGDEVIYAWRYPATNLSTYTQLLVQESQEAVLFSKGKIIGKFGPGKHTLNTENLPILRSLYGIPFGGKNPFTAEVWFVNKVKTFNIEWTIDSMAIHDIDYNTQLPLTAGGQYGLHLVDAERFLVSIVGTKDQFTEQDMTAQFTGEFMVKTKSTIVQYMAANHIGYKQVSAYLDTLSEYLRGTMAPFWKGMGIDLTKFYVSTIDIDTSTPEGRRVKEAIAQQSSMSITGHTWQQEQLFNTANNAMGGMANGQGGLLGGLMAIGMMNGMGAGGGMSMSPQYNQPTFGPQPAGQPAGQPGAAAQPQPMRTKPVYCANCGKKYTSDMQFCPACGKRFNPCPACGSDNDEDARRCVSCGTTLGGTPRACPQCKTPVAPNQAFCPNCGLRLASSETCSRCGATLAPTDKFCPRCGNKRQ